MTVESEAGLEQQQEAPTPVVPPATDPAASPAESGEDRRGDLTIALKQERDKGRGLQARLDQQAAEAQSQLAEYESKLAAATRELEAVKTRESTPDFSAWEQLADTLDLEDEEREDWLKRATAPVQQVQTQLATRVEELERQNQALTEHAQDQEYKALTAPFAEYSHEDPDIQDLAKLKLRQHLDAGLSPTEAVVAGAKDVAEFLARVSGGGGEKPPPTPPAPGGPGGGVSRAGKALPPLPADLKPDDLKAEVRKRTLEASQTGG